MREENKMVMSIFIKEKSQPLNCAPGWGGSYSGFAPSPFSFGPNPSLPVTTIWTYYLIIIINYLYIYIFFEICHAEFLVF